MSKFEDLEKRFVTVFAFYHDAYAEWQVGVDPHRRTSQDCRYNGWGFTLLEAIKALERNIQQEDRKTKK